MEEKLLRLSSKLENFINTQKQEAELNKVKHIENKLSKKMNHMEKHIWGELEKMQNEYQSGEQIPLIDNISPFLSNPSVFYFELMARINLVISDLLSHLI